MSGKLHLILALGAGFLGGIVSHYVTPMPVLAQTQTPAPQEVRAQSFVLVDNAGAVVGTFTSVVSPRDHAVVLLDRSGREVWRGTGNVYRPLSEK